MREDRNRSWAAAAGKARPFRLGARLQRGALALMLDPMSAFRRWLERRRRHRQWESRWRRDDFAPRWGDRGTPPEIVASADAGWFPATGTMLDVGCGQGEIAGWFAERGYRCVALDVSESAVRRARARHAHVAERIEFVARDVCAAPPPDRSYDVVVDRGCLHQIPLHEVGSYVRHVTGVAGPRARFLLFIKAFRDGAPFDDPAERAQRTRWVEDAFAGAFVLERVESTYLDAWHGELPDRRLPGMVFWMTRAGAPA